MVLWGWVPEKVILSQEREGVTELGAGLQAEEMADVGSDAEMHILSRMSFPLSPD